MYIRMYMSIEASLLVHLVYLPWARRADPPAFMVNLHGTSRMHSQHACTPCLRANRCTSALTACTSYKPSFNLAGCCRTPAQLMTSPTYRHPLRTTSTPLKPQSL